MCKLVCRAVECLEEDGVTREREEETFVCEVCGGVLDCADFTGDFYEVDIRL